LEYRSEKAPAVVAFAMSTMSAVTLPRHPLARLAWRADTPLGLVVMFSVGLLVRLLIAPRAGYYADLKIFQAWAVRLADVGPRQFYSGVWADYPPGYLYVLWLLGKLSSPPSYVLLKLPAIFGDLALAGIAGVFAARLAPARAQQVPVRALVAAAVLFNPAVIMVSSVWGQVDVVPVVFVLAALMLIFTGKPSLARESGAFALFAIAVAMKPQAGFVLPVMLYALYRHHLRARPPRGVLRGVMHIVVPVTLALTLWLLLAVPFSLGPVGLLRFYRAAASGYPVTSAFAFNLWGIIGFIRPDAPGVRSGDGQIVPGHPVTVGALSAVHVGTILLVLGAALALWRAHRAIERRGDEAVVLSVAAAATSLIAFAVLTRMHERYMFYSLAFLAPLIVVPRIRAAYVALSALYVVDLWWAYAWNNSRAGLGHDCALPFPGCFGINPLLGGFTTDAWQKKAYSAAVVAIALALLWFGPRWAARQSALLRSEQAEPGVAGSQPTIAT
jgi:hypothetical protein